MDPNSCVREIFSHAVELPAHRRPAFLIDACGDDTVLRAGVESLLVAHEQAGDFLADPSIDPNRFGGPASLGPGSKIGPYTIVELIGEGGCGVVYLAMQESPVRRQVALKLIKPGMDSQAIIARFEAERQTLAMMEHSNIARVFDAGTDNGHPYFVMEYVDGPAITTFCKTLPIANRLLLFTKVCMAVQHAHQKGIIHRDLKPTNILVTMQDGVPTPKIIDFGIAKVLEQPLSGQTVLTALGQFLGTPQYISPEQAGAARDVDTRTDIYSLGGVLYEILAGKPAFNVKTLRSAAAAELERMIREVDPPWPSVRLRNLATSLTEKPAESRTILKLAQTVRGELDWIVMKAMEKDRDRRYETPERLASDILHYLANEPVAAGPPSRIYRFSKFAQRNRALFVSVCLILVIFIAAFVITTMALVRAQRDDTAARAAQAAETQARELADQQRAAAQTSEIAARAAQTAEAKARKLADQQRSAAQGAQAAEAKALHQADQQRTAAQASAIAAKRDETEARAALAAEAQARQQADQQRAAAQASEADAVARAQKLFNVQTFLYRLLNPVDQPAPLDILDYASGQIMTDEFVDHPEVQAPVHEALGNSYLKNRRYPEAEKEYRRAMDALAGSDDLTDLASCKNNVASVLIDQQEYTQAEPLLRDSLATYRKFYKGDNEIDAPVLSNLGIVLSKEGNDQDAEPFLEAAVPIYEKAGRKLDAAKALTELANVLDSLGKHDEATAKRAEATKYHNEIGD